MFLELPHIFATLLGYLIGAVPTAFLVGKGIHGLDLRNKGSRNLGATNTFRVLGLKSGLLVLSIDILKGWGVLFAFSQFLQGMSDPLTLMKLLIGVAAVLGHVFPVYMGFKGGKGVATILGVVLAVHTWAALICLGIFLMLFLLTRYVSLGSLAAGCAFPILIILVFKTEDPALIHFSWIFALLIVFTHHKNIDRLMRNQESKLRFSSIGDKSDQQEA